MVDFARLLNPLSVRFSAISSFNSYLDDSLKVLFSLLLPLCRIRASADKLQASNV